MSTKGVLYLFPTPLSESDITEVIPNINFELIRKLKHFIVEDPKRGRRFLKQCGYPSIPDAELFVLNEHSVEIDFNSFIKPLMDGKDMGLMSDAGCPGIADPGESIVRLAHRSGIKVRPLVGPSSIVLTAMASGFNGQNFAFIGYLPIDKTKRNKRIRELENLCYSQKQSQYFIETPYRNIQLFEDLLQILKPSTMLVLGINISSYDQSIISKSISDWKQSATPAMHKVPTVFGISFN